MDRSRVTWDLELGTRVNRPLLPSVTWSNGGPCVLALNANEMSGGRHSLCASLALLV